MDESGFTAYLKERRTDDAQIERALALAREFDAVLTSRGTDTAHAGNDDASAFADKLLAEGRDDETAILSLARYARFTRNDEAHVAFLALLDGGEVIGNLRRLINERAGEEAERCVFDGLNMPTWGTGSREKARLMRAVMERAQALVPPDTLRDILSGCLHDLPDTYFLPLRDKLRQAESFEAFVHQRRTKFMAEMEEHHRSGTLFYNQKITDAVLDYLRDHEEASVGKYTDGILRVTKIPYMADEWLKETDPVRKRYLYCHCPWARESILGDPELPPVSAEFCRCSMGFSKKPYEVALGCRLEGEIVQTVLNGGEVCEFAIRIPEDKCGTKGDD